jgi:lipoprotein-releasing system permease protein
VLAVTSGFQVAFREKVLGVNAHLLILKYGWDFTEYREVISRARATPGVVGASPFLINPMMITRGDRISGVLVKGIDPELSRQVLDLHSYMDSGTSAGLRRADARPPITVTDELSARADRTLDDYLRRVRAEVAARANDAVVDHPLSPLSNEPLDPRWPNREASTQRSPSAGTNAAQRDNATTEQLLPSGSTPTYALPPTIDAADDPLEQVGRSVIAEQEQHAARHSEQLPGAIVGVTLARNLRVRVGDTVRIISPLTGADAALVRHGSTPRSRDFRVIGIFNAGFDEYDSRLVYVDLWEAQRFFEQGDAVTGVEIKVSDLDRAAAIGRRITRELGDGPFHALDWEALNRNLFTALKLQKLALAIVITIIIVVAAFNVVATLVMLVLDKRKEVAILKAMGADEDRVRRIFLIQGTAIGSVGIALGLLLGGGICAALHFWHFPLDSQVYLIRYVPVQPNVWEFVLTAVISLLISIGASIIPASWAANLTPLEGLRHE